MKKIKSKNFTKVKKLLFDWNDRTKYLIHYRMLKFYVRPGMVVEKIHDINSFKQSRCLENYISFNTKKNEIELKMNLKKISINYLLILLLVKWWKLFAIG